MKQNTTLSGETFGGVCVMHNKLGFFIAGLVIIYDSAGCCKLTGILILLKHNVVHYEKIAPNLDESQVGAALRMRDFKITKKEATIFYFENGNYNVQTGMDNYTTREWYTWIISFTELHKSSTQDTAHYFTSLFGFALLFMSVSAFWMFKPGTKLFSSGVWLTVVGIISSVILLFLH